MLIDRIWYTSRHPLSYLLRPLAWIFAGLGTLRRALFRVGFKQSIRLPVPVIVVGNITAGGTGKTPLTLYLARQLQSLGYRPGIVSRGYGGKAQQPLCVSGGSDPLICGDEPILLARSGVPVYVFSDRAAAGQALLSACPDVDVLLCDDGLQHYRLQRDIELCVVDGERGFGNGALIPAGPLREPVSRLKKLDAVIVNGRNDSISHPCLFQMSLQPGVLYSPVYAPRHAWQGLRVAAVCGIGNPARFFNTLKTLGLVFSEHAFADHHAFVAADLPDADIIVVTEKDAVKLAVLADVRIWVLPVIAELTPDLAGWLGTEIARLKHQMMNINE
ncbi:tetraacyldisaccharide 4'-kinase [Iodobacter sp. HSC-16F04]|uniref:Tetraacyldisaccharide 4'-kinase n=1 Tax=Iodobacter violaceini TaxID=3044271 RepID=A0ABX0KX37_9NEIS|nr:tetraacyldisaccharide 4'-kinase [Iodobacter violacea]NHQ86609.1 tetraacyldisaccharide 4'-kinase [Iodobacter violacea]